MVGESYLADCTKQTLLEDDIWKRLIPFVGTGFTANIHKDATVQAVINDCARGSFAGVGNLLEKCDGDSPRAFDFLIWKLSEQKRFSGEKLLDCYREGKKALYANIQTFLHNIGVHGETPNKDNKNWEQHFALLNCYNEIITTNWENSLESAGHALNLCCYSYYSANGELFRERVGEETKNPLDERTIIKLHGHLVNDERGPYSIVASETDYYHRVRRSDPLDDDILCRLSAKGLLFIGYSLSDVNVRYVLKQVNTVNKYFERDQKSYLVIAEPTPDDTGDKLSLLYSQFLKDHANITVCPLIKWTPDDNEQWKKAEKRKEDWFANRQDKIRKAWSELFYAIKEKQKRRRQ